MQSSHEWKPPKYMGNTGRRAVVSVFIVTIKPDYNNASGIVPYQFELTLTPKSASARLI